MHQFPILNRLISRLGWYSMPYSIGWLLCALLFSQMGNAQPLPPKSQGQQATETVELNGVILGQSGPIPGAHIVLTYLADQNLDTAWFGAATDLAGHFRMLDLPKGEALIKVSAIGFLEQSFQYKIELDQIVVEWTLIEASHELKEVDISAKGSSKALNAMATVSARSFSLDEAGRYAASVFDPAKMALSFAGVKGTDDVTGAIVIRGNNPKGVGWRIEGMEVPTPSHFSTEGAATGAVSMVSNRLLTTSDFYTGAFPAEMGNAVSGIFDLRLRSGNADQRHYSVQASMLGLEASAEGPINRERHSSYLINYRYSTLALMGKMGLNIGNTVTGYQDVNVKMEWPTRKAGVFSVFGIGGLSSVSRGPQGNSGIKDVKSFTYGLAGIRHVMSISPRQNLTTGLAISLAKEDYNSDASALRIPDPILWTYFSNNRTIRLTTRVDAELTPSTQLRYGLVGSVFVFDLFEGKEFPPKTDAEFWEADDVAFFGEAYAQVRHRLSEKLTGIVGLRGNWFAYSGKANIEPRAAIEFAEEPNKTWSLSAGIHSRLESMAYYMTSWESLDGSWTPNQYLDYSKAAHLVFGYTVSPSRDITVRVETYLQYLYDVPVADDTTGLNPNQSQASPYFSAINYAWRYPEIKLTNAGEGLNYGVEFTVERRYNEGWYLLLNGSLFRSLFTARDGEWRPSAWDAGFISNVTLGKDFPVGKNHEHMLGLHGRLLWSGGYRLENTLYTERLPNYFRTDTRLNYLHNSTHPWTLSLDLQNLTNRLNENLIQDIDPIGLIPVLAYRQEF